MCSRSFVVFIVLIVSVCTSQYLNIGALMTIAEIERVEDPNYSGLFELEGYYAMSGWRFWETLVNAKGGIEINGVMHLVNLTAINVGATLEKVIRVTNETCRGDYGQFDLLFSPWGSTYTEAAAIVAYEYDMLLFSGWSSSLEVYVCPDEGWEDVFPCTGPHLRRFPYLWSQLSRSGTTFEDMINILALKGAKTMFTWVSDRLFTLDVIIGTEELAILSGMEFLERVTVDERPTEEQIEIVLDRIEALNPDVIAGASRYLDGCEMFLKRLKERNLSAKAIIQNFCAHANLDEEVKYIIDFVHYNPNVRGSRYEDHLYFQPTADASSSRIFFEEYQNWAGEEPDTAGVANAFAVGELIEFAYSRAASKSTEDVMTILPFVKGTTFLNGIGFDVFGMNADMVRPNVQINTDGEALIVTPLGTSGLDLIYPFPDWEERYQAEGYLERTPEVVIFVITLLAAALSIILIVLVACFPERPSIQASTPSFLILTLVGSLFMYISILCWMMWMNDFMCIAKNWFLGTGFVLLYATLVAKTHRMKKIFIFKSVIIKTISENQLIGLICILVAFELTIHLIWTIAAAPTPEYIVIDPYRPVLNYVTCTYSNVDTIFIIIQSIYKGILVLYSLYLSTVLWKYQKSIYVESREIVFCIYNLTIFCAIFAAVQISLEPTESRDLLFILRSSCILLAVLITVITLGVTKFLRPEAGKEYDYNNVRKGTGSRPSTTNIPSTQHATELRALKRKYRKVKRALTNMATEHDHSISFTLSD